MMPALSSCASTEPAPISPEFNRLEVVNRRRPWLLPYVISVTYVTIR